MTVMQERNLEMASEKTADIVDLDRKYLFHNGDPGNDKVVLVGGEGCVVRDIEGREYLDAHAGAWTTQVGHGRREVADAVAAQMRALAHFSLYWEYTNVPAVKLAQLLVEKAPPSITQVRYGSSGSECDDEALQIVRQYHRNRGQSDRNVVLSVHSAYHGRSLGDWTLAGNVDKSLFIDGNVHQLTPPWPYHVELYGGEDPTDFCVRELEETIEKIGAERIAAMFGEPVMGPAGMIPPPDDYWPRMVEVLHKHGILFVADEVVTAFGRVGHWYASNMYKIEPDVMVLAKGIASAYMPLGAILLSDEVATGVKNVSSTGSYGGHATACAAALACAEIIEREGLNEAARVRGAQLMAELAPLLELPIVGNIRGKGLMLGVELVRSKSSRKPLLSADYGLVQRIRRDAGIILSGGRGTLVITPPLVITEEEVTQLANGLTAILTDFSQTPEVQAELAAELQASS